MFLKRSLDTVDGKVDVVAIVDGAYDGYDSPHSASWDGTLQIIKDYSFKSELIFIPAPKKPWKTQMIKRSQYFKVGKKGDWYLIMDADNTVVHGLDKKLRHVLHISPPFVNGYWIKRVTNINGVRDEMLWGFVPLLVRHQDGLHYKYNHSTIITTEGKPLDNIGDYPHLLLEHHGHKRPKRRAMTEDHRRRGRGEVNPPWIGGELP